MILLIKDHALEKNRWFSNFLCILAAVHFISSGSLTVYRNTHRPGGLSEKACNYYVQEFWAVIFDGRAGTIPIYRVYQLFDNS